MATDLKQYVSRFPGLEQQGAATDRLMIAPEEGQLGYHSANLAARVFGKQLSMLIAPLEPYSTTIVTETKDNSGGGAATITHGAGGTIFNGVGAGADDDATIRSQRTWTLAKSKVYTATGLFQVDTAAKIGVTFGFGTSSVAEYFSANPTDGVYLFKDKTSTALYGRIVQNGAAEVDSAKLADLADATDIEVSVKFCIGNSAALSWGQWWVNGAVTPFSSAQLTALFALMTTPPTLCAQFGVRLGEAVVHSATAQGLWWEVDR